MSNYKNSDIYSKSGEPPLMDEYYGKAVIAIHGGAGAISRAQMSCNRNYATLRRCLPLLKPGRNAGSGRKCAGCGDGSGASAGECPLFNAGIGAVFTRDETHDWTPV